MYDDGPDALRMKRLNNLKKLGIVGRDVIPHDVVSFGVSEWKDMDPEERARTCRSMEVYAGMVQCIDRNVGRVLKYLEDNGELESGCIIGDQADSPDTFVLFMSDNGAEGAMEGESTALFLADPLTEAAPIMGRASLSEVIRTYYDNSLDNMGNYNSFFWYGPRSAILSSPKTTTDVSQMGPSCHCPFQTVQTLLHRRRYPRPLRRPISSALQTFKQRTSCSTLCDCDGHHADHPGPRGYPASRCQM